MQCFQVSIHRKKQCPVLQYGLENRRRVPKRKEPGSLLADQEEKEEGEGLVGFVMDKDLLLLNIKNLVNNI